MAWHAGYSSCFVEDNWPKWMSPSALVAIFTDVNKVFCSFGYRREASIKTGQLRRQELSHAKLNN